MGQYVYAGWFRDIHLKPSDQDHEWVACLLVEAETAADAQAWGDHLAKGICARSNHEKFIGSELLPTDDPFYSGTDTTSLPVVQ